MESFLRKFPRILAYTVLLVGAIFTLIPFLWMLSSSLKSEAEVFVYPIQWIPKDLRFDNYVRAWTSFPFPRFFLNSLIVSTGIIAGQLLTSILAAYAFARFHFKGKNFWFGLLLAGMMIPEQTIMIPVVQLLGKLDWLNTYQGLIVPFVWSSVITFLFRQFFMSLPQEIEEAARVDGCSTLGIIFRIVVPMSIPVISTAFILVFIYAWNQYLWPLLITNNESMYTVQLGLAYFKEENAIETDWTALMAGSTLVMLPMILVFTLFQKRIIDSIASTGGKE